MEWCGFNKVISSALKWLSVVDVFYLGSSSGLSLPGSNHCIASISEVDTFAKELILSLDAKINLHHSMMGVLCVMSCIYLVASLSCVCACVCADITYEFKALPWLDSPLAGFQCFLCLYDHASICVVLKGCPCAANRQLAIHGMCAEYVNYGTIKDNLYAGVYVLCMHMC